MKTLKEILQANKRNVNKNFTKMKRWLDKKGIDYTVSPSKNWMSNSRSIYITLRKYFDYNVQIRISDHTSEKKEKAIEKYCVYVDYKTKVDFKKFKKDLQKVGTTVIEDINTLKEGEVKFMKSLTPEQQKELKTTYKKEISKLKKNGKYVSMIRDAKFGLATRPQRLQLLTGGKIWEEN